jgi:RNA polymerase sigma-70 factor, ECF subfamily
MNGPSTQLREIHPPRVAERATLPVQSSGSKPGWRTPQDRAQGWALVTAVQAGDREAFGRLYTRYEPQVRAFIRRRVQDVSTVEDLTSDTFLSALRGIEGVHDQGTDVIVWLLTIAKNRVLNHLDRAHVRRETPTSDTTTGVSGVGGDVSQYGNPEQEVLAAIERAAISTAIQAGLARLCPSQRTCVRLFDLEERPLIEVMAATGRSEQGVYSTRKRARHQLAHELDPHGVAGPRRYAQVTNRALTAYGLQSRLREPKPVQLSPEQAALAECHTQADALRVAWRFLGVSGTPQTSDVTSAVEWLAGQGMECDVRWAYTVRRKIAAAEQAGGFHHAETEGAAA